MFLALRVYSPERQVSSKRLDNSYKGIQEVMAEVRSSDPLQPGGLGRLWGLAFHSILLCGGQEMYSIYPPTDQQWPCLKLTSFDRVWEGV